MLCVTFLYNSGLQSNEEVDWKEPDAKPVPNPPLVRRSSFQVQRASLVNVSVGVWISSIHVSSFYQYLTYTAIFQLHFLMIQAIETNKFWSLFIILVITQHEPYVCEYPAKNIALLYGLAVYGDVESSFYLDTNTYVSTLPFAHSNIQQMYS